MTEDEPKLGRAFRRRVLPPEPEAVREALEAPERPKPPTRTVALVALLLGLLAAVPLPSPTPEAPHEDPFSEVVRVPIDMPLDVVAFLRPDGREGAHRMSCRLGIELEFLVKDGDLVKETLLESGRLEQAEDAAAECLSRFSRTEFIVDEVVSTALQRELSRVMFPDELATVVGLSWVELKFD